MSEDRGTPQPAARVAVRLLVRRGAAVEQVELDVGAQAQAADLAAVLGGEVLVRGQRVPGRTPLRALPGGGLRDGDLVDVVGPVDLAHPAALDGPADRDGPDAGSAFLPAEGELSPVPLPGHPAWELAVISGPDAGASTPLAGPTVVGRGPGVDVDLAAVGAMVPRRAVLLTPVPAAPRHGAGSVLVQAAAGAEVRVDGVPVPPGTTAAAGPGAVLSLPGVDLGLRVPVEDRPYGADHGLGAIPFPRPPRSPVPETAQPVALPAPPPERTSEPLSLATLVAPLLMAVVMVLLTHDLRFALFSALTPLLAVGTWWEGRRRRASATRRDRALLREQLEDLAGALAAASVRERERLRDLAPDLAEVLRRAALPSRRLWERRDGDPFLMWAALGLGEVAWSAPCTESGPVAPEALDLLARHGALAEAPVVVDLAGRCLGIVGDRALSLPVARAVVCGLAVTAGPRDLHLRLHASAGYLPAWSWWPWLPHARAGDRARLVVLDGPAQAVPEPSAGDAVVVLARHVDALPARCDLVLHVDSGDLVDLRSGRTTRAVRLAGLSAHRAAVCARQLARWSDPDAGAPEAGLPALVRLLPLLGLGGTVGELAQALAGRWRAADGQRLRTPLGTSRHGVLELDLVRDGAHGLVGGTTGSGKSELLRSVVAGLAAGLDPQALTFVLVDYKGGAAFDACARLPHVVGLVTDLDEQLGARALRSLEAELARREHVLRVAGVADLPAYRAARRPHDEPLPRLVVVVDEFATLAKELPSFVHALVDVAQRGRTLGVHLLLATQRPSGVISEDIRANTNLRLALRVQDRADSTDVLGVPDAAELPRDLPGRAYARFGPGEVVPLQTALVSCPPADADPPVRVRPEPGQVRAGPPAAGPSDLERLVDAAVLAWAGRPAPRRPWLPALPDHVALDDLLPEGSAGLGRPAAAAPFALADDPDGQQQLPLGWDPRSGGLLLLGVPGSGTTTALLALATALAASRAPSELELYALDLGAGDLAALRALPHTGAVVEAADAERQVRLVRRLQAELARRRAMASTRTHTVPQVVLLVDGLAALRAAYDDAPGLELMDALARLHADGPEVGIALALTADRPGVVPSALSAVTPQRWVFRLADAAEAGAAGLSRAELPPAVAGRAVVLPQRLQVQVGRPGAHTLARVAKRWRGAPVAATAVPVLPDRVDPVELGPADVAGDGWVLPVGIAESDLSRACVTLHAGEGLLVAGPRRSGRTGALLALATALREAGVVVVASGGRRSPLAGDPLVDRWVAGDDLASQAPGLLETRQPTVLLVDDAEQVPDPDGALTALLTVGPGHLRVLAAGSTEGLRSAYGHWTSVLRRSRAGLLLRPSADLDGDLLAVTLPRRSPVPLTTGRGYLVADGAAVLVQAATGS